MKKLLMPKEKEIKQCPDCDEPLKFEHEMDTDWYGHLAYWWCKNCKERFVSQNNGELEIAAKP